MTASAKALISKLPKDQRMVTAVAYEVLRKSAPTEQYEIGRASAVVEFLEAFGVAAAERLVSRWSNEGVPS